MARSPDFLYHLLPAVHRERDAARGGPLSTLLRVIGEQIQVVEDDIAQLYDNWFVETCEDWVVPYIADLVGYRIVHEAGEPGAVTTIEGRAENRVLIPRREVAGTIGYRRRKGTLALLEILARDVAGWPARAVEFYRRLDLAPHLDHPHPHRGRTVDLRDGNALDRHGLPFDTLAHTVDVRRISSHRSMGRYNVPSVGLSVWRLCSFPVTKAPAFCVDRVRYHYTFSVLGNDAPLLNQPTAEPELAPIRDESQLPVPIRRRVFDEYPENYYGPGKSLQIWRDDLDHPVSLDKIVPADLSRWAYRPQEDQIAVDPVLGRLAFSPRNAPRTGVWVSYSYGFSAPIGGGEYQRLLRAVGARAYYAVRQGDRSAPKEGTFATIREALLRWQADAADDAVIEILDSSAYGEQIDIELTTGRRLELRAAKGTRPVIRLLDWYSNRPDAMGITGTADPEEPKGKPAGHILLDGLMIAGRGVQISGPLAQVTFRHCTLVPGWSLDPGCEPENETEASLELTDTGAELTIEHSIVGAIRVNENEGTTDPIRVVVTDSILDAVHPDREAIGAPERPFAHAQLTIARCTVFGRAHVHALELAENSIFEGCIAVARRQIGCVRFCSVPRGSRTPRRFECQPDLVERAVVAEIKDPAERERVSALERLRVRPQFDSVRYGTPPYARLSDGCADEIRRGADDESEMGVFHDLFAPQREANLRARLDEYTPAGMDAGILFAD